MKAAISQHMEATQRKYNAYYDKTVRQEPPIIVGDEVYNVRPHYVAFGSGASVKLAR